MSRRRGAGEGSIYRFRDGWAAYVWITQARRKAGPQMRLRQVA
jgi:hypothetical protein